MKIIKNTHTHVHAQNLYRSSLKSNDGTSSMQKTQKSGERGIIGGFRDLEI
jgi:hypothetical protein